MPIVRTPLLATSSFTLRRLEGDDVLVALELSGQLGAEVIDRTVALVEAEMATRRHLLLFLRHLTFIDSTGLGGLLRLCAWAHDSRREIELFGPLCPTVCRAVALAGLTSLVQTPSNGPTQRRRRRLPAPESPGLPPAIAPYGTSDHVHPLTLEQP